jgi:glutamyl/glutaminyl-tRNA synthetase
MCKVVVEKSGLGVTNVEVSRRLRGESGNDLLLRFDDTNPSNEKQEFEDAIVEDLALMGIKPNI